MKNITMVWHVCLLAVFLAYQPVRALEVSAGKINTISNFPSQFVPARDVHVWLPEGYSDEKKYAVLYMHDGQMLFDSKTTWNQQEWGVDEVAARLQTNEDVVPFIVVGINNINERRYQEYFPQKAMNFLSAQQKNAKHRINQLHFYADDYLRFLVEELNPYIQRNYSTDPKNTAIAGSSMGGLISWYALMEYPEVFQTALCLSTHWPGGEPEDPFPIFDALLAYMDNKISNNFRHRLYFDHGNQTLDAYYPPYQQKVDELLNGKSYSKELWMSKAFSGHAHDEKSWRSRLHIPLTFAFKKVDSEKPDFENRVRNQ